MTLTAAVEAYVRLKQSLGAVFSVDARILAAFVRAVGDVSLSTITPEMCATFCRGQGPPTRFWSRKHEALRGLFRYLVGRGHLTPRCTSPARGFSRPSSGISIPTTTWSGYSRRPRSRSMPRP